MIAKYGLINHFDKINAYLSVIFDELPKNLLPKQDGERTIRFIVSISSI